MVMLQEAWPILCGEFRWLNLGFVMDMEAIAMGVEPTLDENLQKGQAEDENIKESMQNI